MPWYVSWQDAEQSILLYELTEPTVPWTWEEFETTIQQGQMMQTEKDYMVDVIYSLATPIRMPDMRPLAHFQKVYATDPENSGLNAVIGASRLVERLVSVITSAMGGKASFTFVSNMDEALAAIGRVRAERGG